MSNWIEVSEFITIQNDKTTQLKFRWLMNGWTSLENELSVVHSSITESLGGQRIGRKFPISRNLSKHDNWPEMFNWPKIARTWPNLQKVFNTPKVARKCPISRNLPSYTIFAGCEKPIFTICTKFSKTREIVVKLRNSSKFFFQNTHILWPNEKFFGLKSLILHFGLKSGTQRLDIMFTEKCLLPIIYSLKLPIIYCLKLPIIV